MTTATDTTLDYFRELVTHRLEAGVVDRGIYIGEWRRSIDSYARVTGNREYARHCHAVLDELEEQAR